jgi:hypothetical protein
MPESIKIDFQPFGRAEAGDLVVFVADDLKPGPTAARLVGEQALELFRRVAGVE